MRKKENIGPLIRAVRGVIGLSQQEIADRSDGLLSRAYVAQVESGSSKGNSYMVRVGFAKSFSVDVDKFGKYLAGDLSITELLATDIKSNKSDFFTEGRQGPIMKFLIRRLKKKYKEPNKIPKKELAVAFAASILLGEKQEQEWLISRLQS